MSEKTPKSCKRFQIDISCRFGSSCAYFHLDHSGEKKITNELKVEVDNLEKATKEGIDQVKATAQHPSEKVLFIETKQAHSNEYPVAEVIENVEHKEKQNKNNEILNRSSIFKGDQFKSKYAKKAYRIRETKHLNKSDKCLKCNNYFNSEVNLRNL